MEMNSARVSGRKEEWRSSCLENRARVAAAVREWVGGIWQLSDKRLGRARHMNKLYMSERLYLVTTF